MTLAGGEVWQLENGGEGANQTSPIVAGTLHTVTGTLHCSAL